MGAGDPENRLTGTTYVSNHNLLPVTVPGRMAGLRLWRGTNLPTASSTALTAGTVGYESDEDLDNDSGSRA